MRKLLSVMLVLVLVLTQFVVPTFAFDEEEFTDPYEGLAIESITAEAQYPLIENADGDWVVCYCNDVEEEYFEYFAMDAEPIFTVVYEDGSEEVGTWLELTGDMEVINDQCENHWGLGKHEVTVIYRDAECTFEVEVIETPVESVTAVAQKVLVEEWDSYEDYYYDDEDNEVVYERYDLYKAEPVFTVTFKDGSVITGTDEELYEQTGYYTYDVDEQIEKPLVVGKNTVTFTYMGVDFTCEIEVIANPYESIEISGDNEIIIKFNGIDEEDTYETKVVDCYGLWIDAGYIEGVFVTEDGKEYDVVYNYYFDEENGAVLNYMVSLEVGPYVSNTLEVNMWLLARIAAEEILYYSLSYASVSEDLCGHAFDGVDFTDDELCVDSLVAISTYICDLEPADEDEYYYYHELDAETVAANIAAVFGVTDIDVTTSTFYDSEAEMFYIDEPADSGVYYETLGMTYADGKWTLNADVYDYDDNKVGEISVVLTTDGFVDSITYKDTTPKLGDANGDGKVDVIDARWILQYIAELRTDEEINLEYIDVNEDGDVTAVDARWVLQMVAGLR